MNGELLTAITICAIGSALIIAQFLLRRKRLYLLFLGLAFVFFGAYPTIHWAIVRLILVIISVVFVLLSAWQAYEDTQDRLAAFYKEQRQREEAFSEYVKEVARAKKSPQPPPPEDHE